MKKNLTTILPVFIFFLSLPLFFNSVQAAYFKFDQTTISVASGGTFQIAVMVEPGSDSLNAAEAYVTYDSGVLNATSVAAGSLFPTVSHDVSTAGKVYIAGMVNDPASSISVSGTLATITFQASNTGTGSVPPMSLSVRKTERQQWSSATAHRIHPVLFRPSVHPQASQLPPSNQVLHRQSYHKAGFLKML